jgi:leader peptidase (prepilin peptidase)/N-methyltransferase
MYSPTFKNIILLIVLSLLFFALLFLAYYDLKKMEVHKSVSFVLLVLLLILNILVFLLSKDNQGIQMTESWRYDSYQNILGAIALGAIFQLIVLLTKEKGLGQGDVRISLITGLIIGFNNLIYWSYISIFSALLFGALLALMKQKKIKGLKIPFVPFMVLGVIVLLITYL